VLRFAIGSGVLLSIGCALDRFDGLSSGSDSSGSSQGARAGQSGEPGSKGGTGSVGGIASAMGGDVGSSGDAGDGGNAEGGTAGELASAGSAGLAAAGAGGNGTICDVPVAPDTACVDGKCNPQGIRISGASGTRFGGDGGYLTFDLCLEGEVLIAFSWATGVSLGRGTDSRVLGLQAECGKLTLEGSGTYSVKTSLSRVLLARGRPEDEPIARGRAACPENQVIVGVKGTFGFLTGTSAYGAAIKALTFECAALNVTSESGRFTTTTSGKAPLASFGTVTGDAVHGESPCAEGEVARGVALRSGRWIDEIGVVCGAAKVMLPSGAACDEPAQCISGICETTCKPRPPCKVPCGCECLNYELREYAFCNTWAGRQEANARCKSAGMHLPHPNTLAESGWLRTAAVSLGMTAPLWIGVQADSQQNWEYTDNGGAVPLALQLPYGDTFWRTRDNMNGNELCAELAVEGGWNDIECTAPVELYACER
jgi:hypothetical protein